MSGKIAVINHYSKYVQLLPGNKGLSIDEKMPFEAYSEAVQAYGAIVADGLWALGDLFRFGEATYGEMYAQAFESLKYSQKTITDATWVCSVFPPSRRHKALTFNHHKIVAGLEPEDREELLNLADKEELSTRALGEIKKKKFPPKARKKKKDATSDDSDQPPELPKAARVTQPDFLHSLDIAISFLEQQDAKASFLPEFREKIATRLAVLRRNARRLGFMGGNK